MKDVITKAVTTAFFKIDSLLSPVTFLSKSTPTFNFDTGGITTTNSSISTKGFVYSKQTQDLSTIQFLIVDAKTISNVDPTMFTEVSIGSKTYGLASPIQDEGFVLIFTLVEK